MRKFRSILTLVLALVMSVSMVACAEEAVLPSADVEEQGYDFYDGAVEYNEIRDSLGAVPAISDEITLGFTTKTFENEFWRMEKEGAEAAAKMFQDAGYNVTWSTRAMTLSSSPAFPLATSCLAWRPLWKPAST